MISNEKLAHDLSIVYLVNRYGPEVSGSCDVQTYRHGELEVTGQGTVETQRLPEASEVRTISVGTGEKYFFNLLEKRVKQGTGERLVDTTFRSMISEYRHAYNRFLELLASE